MIWHPLLLSVFTIDALSLLLIAGATVSALRIVAGWSPEAAGPAKTDSHRRVGTTSVQGRIGLALLSLSTLVLVVGITGVFPKIVSGAMCGKGVLQATNGAVGKALALRGLALGLLAVWHLLDRLNLSRPDSPLATVAARTLLVASPVAVLAVYDTLQAILRLDVNRPVDCCSTVYGRIRSAGQAAGASGIPDAYWVWGLFLGGIAIILLGVHLGRSFRSLGVRANGFLALVTILWVPVAATALARSLAPYLHGVPRDRCPWCLFLPQHRLVGYLLFGCLILVAAEAGAAFVSSMVAAKFPAMETETCRRSRAAGLRITIAAILFLALAGIPAIMC